MTEPQPRYRKGDHIGGRYLVHQALLGGMGEVYLCVDLQQNYPLALKTFQARYLTNPRIRQLFAHEVGTWIALEKHPNIVRCFYMDMLAYQPFMFLEWVAGEEGYGTDLRSWIRRGPLNLRMTLEVVIDICQGLIHAQAKQPGIVHRDLKPENILVAQGRLAKITDFGLASLVQQSSVEPVADESAMSGRQTLIGSRGVVGTPPYMAPEQWRGEVCDVRTDLYAIGCILYELLTGQLPYRATTLDAMRRQHEQAPLPIVQPNYRLPTTLNAVLATCLAKRAEQRFTTVEDLLEAMTALYQQELGTAPRVLSATNMFSAIEYSNRGNTYAALERHEEALADYNRAIKLDPAYATAQVNRGALYAKLKRNSDALADYERAIELNPTLIQSYINRANTYAALGRHEEALVDYAQAVELDPSVALVYVNRGALYAMLRRHEDALADYSRAIGLDPSVAQTYYNRGDTYAELARHGDALTDYSRAVELDPSYAVAYYNRGNTYRTLGLAVDALVDYSRVIELDPALVEGYVNRAGVYTTLGRHEEALADYSHAIELSPEDAETYYNRGVVYATLGRHEEALADYSHAIKLDPSYAMAHVNRGVLYATLERHDEALADYSRAIELEPTYAPAFSNRGNIYGTLGHVTDAIGDFARAIALDPTFASAYVNRGVLLSNTGHLAKALRDFEQAAQLGDPIGKQYTVRARQLLGMSD